MEHLQPNFCGREHFAVCVRVTRSVSIFDGTTLLLLLSRLLCIPGMNRTWLVVER